MSKRKQSIQKEFLKKGCNVDFNKNNGQYNVYRRGSYEGYFRTLDDAQDFLSIL